MNTSQIRAIVESGRFPGATAGTTWVETHISWVILTPEFAFKIKKPVKLSFLDFSTPALRAHFCREEYRLNRRLSEDMYIGVLPVHEAAAGACRIGAGEGAVIDHAVWMKRMDNRRQMDRLLAQNMVSEDDLEALASVLVSFHQKMIRSESEALAAGIDNRADFDDLFALSDVVSDVFGQAAKAELQMLENKAHAFLDKHHDRLKQRMASGFWVEGHGDLHARNIFLLPNHRPVVFDCIEFSEHFRTMDVLSELAFLCMELDANGHPELARLFMSHYLTYWKCIENEEDEVIFQYFKAYRANVRLKVGLLAGAPDSDQEREKWLDRTKGYWLLMKEYFNDLHTRPVEDEEKK